MEELRLSVSVIGWAEVGAGKQELYLIDQGIIQNKQREEKDLGQCYCGVKIANLELGMSDCVARFGERKQKLD